MDNASRDAYDERAACPLYTAIRVIDGRWKPMIFQRLSERPRGFGELRRAMPSVTTKVLREQLRQLAADDLVGCAQRVPAHLGVRYFITPYGRTLERVFETLWTWGRSHLDRGARRGTHARPPRTGSAHRPRIRVK